MKYQLAYALTMTLLTGSNFAAVTAAPATASDTFFKASTNRAVTLETIDGKRIKAIVSHEDASQLKLKPGAQFKLFSIEPPRKIWKNPKDPEPNSNQ